MKTKYNWKKKTFFLKKKKRKNLTKISRLKKAEGDLNVKIKIKNDQRVSPKNFKKDINKRKKKKREK